MSADRTGCGDPQPDGGHGVAGLTETDRATATDGGYLPSGWKVLPIASREYRLTVRSRWAVGIALLFGVFTGGVVQFGATSVGPGRFDAVVATVAELGVYLVPLAALALGYDTVVGAAERGSLDQLLALPVRREGVVVGTFLGRAAVLSGAILVGFLPGAGLTLLYLGIGSLGAYATVAVAAVLAGCATLGVAVLVSTLAATKTHALGASLGVWLWVAVLHDLLALGAVGSLGLGHGAIAAAVLLNPVDCFRVLALAQVDVVAGGFAGTMAAAGLSTPLVAAALVGWVVVPVGIAARALGRR